jgi:uncharacterized protein (DUF433 family)
MPKTIAEQNALEVPLYTYLDAARYLRIPVWVAFAQSEGHRLHPKELVDYFFRAPFLPFHFADDEGLPFWEDVAQRLSFRSLATLFVRSSVFHIPPTQDRRSHWHGDDWRHLFEITQDAFHHTDSDSAVFADPILILSKLEQFAGHPARLDRAVIRKLIAVYLDRVELKDGQPVRLYPFSRDPTPGAPRVVVIDPEVRFGRPTVKGAPTDVLAERWRGGDAPDHLAEDYGLTSDEVNEALRYESLPQSHTFPFLYFGW